MGTKNCMTAFVVFVVLLAGISTAPAAGQNPAEVTVPSTPPLQEKSSENAVTFVSATGERLTASFDMQAGNVTLTLPDGFTARLPRAISGSGARYADDRMIFWEHQGEASVWIGEKLIFKGAPASQIP